MNPRQVILLTSLLSGCAVGPDYQPPQPDLPPQWHAAHTQGNPLKPVSEDSLRNWWTTFQDPTLNRLMQRARQGNLDLGMAWTRIEQSRAERSAHRAALLPRINGTAGGAYFDQMLPGPSQGDNSLGFFFSGIDALWEIDLFGRLRRKLEAATAQTESATEGYREAWVLLSAEVAREYTEYRTLQHLLRITLANLKSQRHTVELTRQLFNEGVGNRYDLTRATAQAEATAAHIPDLEGQLTATRHRLEILMGAPPGELEATLTALRDIPSPQSRKLLTTPAATLQHRPDIRQAERDLAAATAHQGAAIGELFPKISVAAFMGVRDSDLENLFRSTAFSWASGSAIMQPLFNFGRIRAGINLADARQQEAWLNYRKTVLEALGETETAMTRFLKEEQRRQQLSQSVTELKESARLAELRYREGVASFLEVLEAQRALFIEELELTRTRARTTQYQIALYKALGGSDDLDIQPADDPLRPWG